MSFDFNREIIKQDLDNSNIVDKILIDQVVREFKNKCTINKNELSKITIEKEDNGDINLLVSIVDKLINIHIFNDNSIKLGISIPKREYYDEGEADTTKQVLVEFFDILKEYNIKISNTIIYAKDYNKFSYGITQQLYLIDLYIISFLINNNYDIILGVENYNNIIPDNLFFKIRNNTNIALDDIQNVIEYLYNNKIYKNNLIGDNNDITLDDPLYISNINEWLNFLKYTSANDRNTSLTDSDIINTKDIKAAVRYFYSNNTKNDPVYLVYKKIRRIRDKVELYNEWVKLRGSLIIKLILQGKNIYRNIVMQSQDYYGYSDEFMELIKELPSLYNYVINDFRNNGSIYRTLLNIL